MPSLILRLKIKKPLCIIIWSTNMYNFILTTYTLKTENGYIWQQLLLRVCLTDSFSCLYHIPAGCDHDITKFFATFTVLNRTKKRNNFKNLKHLWTPTIKPLYHHLKLILEKQKATILQIQNILKEHRNELRGEDIKMYVLDRHGLLRPRHQSKNGYILPFFSYYCVWTEYFHFKMRAVEL